MSETYRPTEKLLALFKRIDTKGIPIDDVDWTAEMSEQEVEMERGLCSVCCFAECRCEVKP